MSTPEFCCSDPTRWMSTPEFCCSVPTRWMSTPEVWSSRRRGWMSTIASKSSDPTRRTSTLGIWSFHQTHCKITTNFFHCSPSGITVPSSKENALALTPLGYTIIFKYTIIESHFAILFASHFATHHAVIICNNCNDNYP